MENQPSHNPEALLRNWQIMWGAMFFSYVTFAAMSWFAGQPQTLTGGPGFVPLFPVLALLGCGTLAASFVVYKKMFGQAVAQQKPTLLQSGYIVAWALCEATCLFGLLGIFMTKALAFYAFFAVAALGMMAHRPRRDALHATLYKKF